jgi:hypothetical protein
MFTMYYERCVAAERGLTSYGAGHRGTVSKRFPAKFALMVNMMTAKSIGPAITDSFLLRAGEVIE